MATMITEHFSLEEATKSASAEAHGIDNSISEDMLYKLKILYDAMEVVRQFFCDHYNEEVHINVHSIYRCPELNKLVKGQPTSQHMSLEAMDFNCSIGTNEENWDLLKKSDLPYDQLILEHSGPVTNNWVHYSIKREGTETPRHMAFTLEKK